MKFGDINTANRIFAKWKNSEKLSLGIESFQELLNLEYNMALTLCQEAAHTAEDKQKIGAMLAEMKAAEAKSQKK